MIFRVAFVVVSHLLVLGLEVPLIVRRRLRREGVVVLTLVAINIAIGLIITMRLPVPGPGVWLEWLFGPLGAMLSG